MSFEQIDKFIQDVQDSPELMKRMEGGDFARGMELAKELGYDFTWEEAKEYVEKLNM
ncbi:MAG: Nif11-like leader peptide family natural product precursor [Coriobacteriaceae bacterium]|nr:Nif11-like leader peptide family natural product precursor [Coriobacteriaceae bacterium]